MKRNTLFILILILFQSSLFAQSPNLDGFKNLKWGISSVQVYKSIDPKDKSWHYDLLLDGGNEVKISEFAGRRLEQAFLYFHEDKLCRVSIYFADPALESYSVMKKGNPKWNFGEEELNKLFNEIMSEIDEKYFSCVKKNNSGKWIFSDGNFIELGGRGKNSSLKLSYVNTRMEEERIKERDSYFKNYEQEKKKKTQKIFNLGNDSPNEYLISLKTLPGIWHYPRS
ncbi:MAG TPA: hypothetical protein VIK10_12835 [Prolixibacteraceae bacterium]